MKYDIIKFSSHSIKRMFERKISKDEIVYILNGDDIIKEYPNDKPYPSFLIAGFINTRPIHIVAAYDEKTKTCYIATSLLPIVIIMRCIITVYESDPELWKSDFKERRLS